MRKQLRKNDLEAFENAGEFVNSLLEGVRKAIADPNCPTEVLGTLRQLEVYVYRVPKQDSILI